MIESGFPIPTGLVNPFQELTDCGRGALRVLVGASQRLSRDDMVHQAELRVVAQVCPVALAEGQAESRLEAPHAADEASRPRRHAAHGRQ